MTEPVPEAPRRGLKRKTKLVLLGVLFAPIALFVLYTWAALTWDFSDGERAGILQKFSEKGWICKTWEGELALVSLPGSTTEKFYFTVHDDTVAQAVKAATGKRVTLHYEEKVGLPTSCFGETRHFVSNVTINPDIPLGPGVSLPTAPPAPASAPAAAASQ